MSIREAVARSICKQDAGEKCLNCNGSVQRFVGPLKDGTSHQRDRPCPYLAEADAAITAFLEAAATIPDKHGRTWHMRPDEATEEMKHAAFMAMDSVTCRGDPKARAWDCLQGYRAMIEAAPKFELGE